MEHKGTRILETERLILRPFTKADGPAMYKNWTSDPQVTRFLTWPTHESEAVSSQIAALWEEKAKQPGCYQWAVVLKDLNEPIGSLAIVRMEERLSQCELGYCLGRAWQKQGLMTEAVRAVIRYLIQEVGMVRIEARHDVKNPASGRVMQKAGMAFEGVLRQSDWNNTGRCDLAVYAILAQDLKE